MHCFWVKVPNNRYKVIIGRNNLKKLFYIINLMNLGQDVVLIIDENIKQLYGTIFLTELEKYKYNTKVISIEAKEENKSFDKLGYILNEITEFDIHKRSLFIIVFGGGVIGDIGGFAAAIYKRGIKYIYIPTTLIAQVDASIGGKTGVNLTSAKNMVGAFYHPKLVFMDISLLKSLPIVEIRAGLIEVLKTAIIGDGNLFNFVETNMDNIFSYDLKALEYIVYKSSKIKADIVKQDEKDKLFIRAKLNLGHTIGHAIEAATEYKLYRHGEAVGVGIIIETQLATKLNLIEEEPRERIINLVRKILPTNIKTNSLDVDKIMVHIVHDKKFSAGKMRFALPVNIGEVRIIEDIKDSLVKEAIVEGCTYLAR